MKVAIIDQNEHDLDELSHYLLNYLNPDIDIFLYRFDDNNEFIKILFEMIDFSIFFINNETCQLLTFMTIQELYPNASIIVTTSNQSMIDLNNHQLLFKPFDKTKLFRCFDYWIKSHRIHNHLIKVKHQDYYRYLHIRDIYYFESYYGHVYVHTKNKKYLAKTKELYKYENALIHHGFLSIHKSLLVNSRKIKTASLDQYHLKNDTILYPSARKKNQAFKKYQELMTK